MLREGLCTVQAPSVLLSEGLGTEVVSVADGQCIRWGAQTDAEAWALIVADGGSESKERILLVLFPVHRSTFPDAQPWFWRREARPGGQAAGC